MRNLYFFYPHGKLRYSQKTCTMIFTSSLFLMVIIAKSSRNKVPTNWPLGEHGRVHMTNLPCRRCIAPTQTSCPSGTQSWARLHFAAFCKQACNVGSMLTLPARTLQARKRLPHLQSSDCNCDSLQCNTFILCQPFKDFFDMPNQKNYISLTLRCSP